jgi:hypothetical protein
MLRLRASHDNQKDAGCCARAHDDRAERWSFCVTKLLASFRGLPD